MEKVKCSTTTPRSLWGPLCSRRPLYYQKVYMQKEVKASGEGGRKCLPNNAV